MSQLLYSQVGLLNAVEILPQKFAFVMALGSTALFGLAFGIGGTSLAQGWNQS
jgi:hypothetical protein